MMNHINGTQTGRSNYEVPAKNQPAHTGEKSGGIAQAAKTDRFEQAGGVKLSEKAQNLLKELKAKYGDTDFVIADYDSDEEASHLLAGGTKKYSVLIDPQTLEKMAADENVRAKYEGLIDSTRAEINSVVEELVENGQSAYTVGASVSDDGTMEMFAELEEMTAKRSEQIEKNIEENRAEKKEEKEKEAEKAEKDEPAEKTEKTEKKHRHSKITRFVADTAEKLLDSIFRFFGITPKKDGIAVAQKPEK